MKKRFKTIKKAVFIGLALALALPLFACKKGEAPLATPEPTAIVTEQPTAEATELPTSAPTEVSTQDPEAKRQADIEKRVADYCAIMRPSMEALAEQLQEAGMSVEALAEGRDLVFKYTYSSSIIDGTPASVLRESLDRQGAAFMTTYNALVAFVGDDSVRFVLRYVDSKGKTLINYVIDKDYESLDDSAAFNPGGYDSLRELVESDYFIGQLEAAAGMSEFGITAEVEGENTLVINYLATRSFSESEIDTLKSEMEKTFKANAGEMTDAMSAMISLLVPNVDADEIRIVYRMYTDDGELVYEFRQEHLPSGA